MLSFIKKISLCLVIAFFALATAHETKAQTPSPASSEQSVIDFYNKFPEIYIDSITLPQATYKAMDTVTGSFNIRNAKNFDVPNVSYDVALAGNYSADGLAGVLYDKVRGGPFDMKAGEIKKVSFSYDIPEALNGAKFGINVTAVLQDGLSLGWADSLISVTGGKSALDIDKASVSANGKDYGAQAGPTIKKGDSASLKITFKNPNNESITAIPVMTLKKFIAGGTPIEFKGDAVTVNKKGSKDISIVLNTSYDPAVYVGSLSLVDENGLKRSPAVEFRYIVGGDIINFQSVSADKTVLNKGDKFNFSVIYSGAPIDIDRDLTTTTEKANTVVLSVKIFNELDVLTAEYSNPNFDFNSGYNLSLPLTSSVDAKALRAEIVASRDGVVVAQYKANLSSNFAEAQKLSRKALADAQISESVKKIIFAVAFILILGVVIFLSIKFLKNKSSLTMLVALFALLSFFFVNHRAEAFTVDSVVYNVDIGWKLKSGVGLPNGALLVVNVPAEGGYLAPGETFKPSGSYKFAACQNQDNMSIEITASYRGTSKTLPYNFNANAINNLSSHYSSLGSNFAFTFPFTVANLPGSSERVDFTVVVYGQNRTKWLTLKGHQDFKIMQKPMPKFSASPNPIVPTNDIFGPGTTLTWSVPDTTGQTYTNTFCIAGAATGDAWMSDNPTYSSTPSTLWVAMNSPRTFTIQCSKTFHGVQLDSDLVSVDIGFSNPKGSIQVVRVDGNGNLSTLKTTAYAADGTFVSTIPTSNSSANNPALFSNLDLPGVSDTIAAGSTQIGGVKAGQCRYPIGGTECTKPADYNLPLNCTGSVCWAMLNNLFSANTVTKVFFMYGATTTTTGTPGNPGGGTTALTVGLQAIPTTFCTGGTLLKWVSTNASECHSSDFSTGSAANNLIGVSYVPSSGIKTISITCTGPGGVGSATSNVTLNVCPPQLSLVAKPKTVSCGGASTLYWASSNVNNCVGTGFDTGGASNNSTGVAVGPINANTNYKIDCVPVSSDFGTKISFPATVTTDCSGSGGSSTGSIEVGRVNYLFSVFNDLSTEAWYDSVAHISSNYAVFQNVPIGSHTVSVSVPAGSVVTGVATCNTANCLLNTDNLYTDTGLDCSAGTSCTFTPPNITKGNLTRVMFMYQKENPLTLKATLMANPTSGPFVLTSALNAQISGSLVAKKSSNLAGALAANSAGINFKYKFRCYTADTAPVSVTTTSVTASSNCTYDSAGSYTASVRVTGGGYSARGTAQITVSGFGGTGVAQAYRVDGNLNPIPDIKSYIDGNFVDTFNPSSITTYAGSHTIGVDQSDTMSLSVAQCTYPSGGSCDITDPAEFTIVPDCDTTTNICSVPVDVTQGQVTKTVFMYSSPSTATGDFLVRRLDASDQVTNLPAGTTLKFDGVVTSENPKTYTSQSGTHSFSVNEISEYQTTVGTCTYTPPTDSDCTVTDFSDTDLIKATNIVTRVTWDTLNVDAVEGQVVKIVFRYAPSASPLGDVQISRVGDDGNESSAPVGTQTRIGLGTPSSDNPISITDLNGPTDSISVSPVDGYAVSFGICNYDPAVSFDCTVNSYGQVTSSLDGWPKVPGISAITGKVQKAVFKYSPCSGDACYPGNGFCEPESATSTPASVTNPQWAQYVGKPIRWTVVRSSYDPASSYTWTDGLGNTLGSYSAGSISPDLSATYTTTGNKTVMLTVTKNNVVVNKDINCSASSLGGGLKKFNVIVDPNIRQF